MHRDIKPENILLHDGQALVADFGIALAASRTDGSTRMTETGMSLGTPQYMAPEQAMGERDVSLKADVYALGCVLYEMLVGEPPFAGPTPQAIVARMLTEAPRGLSVQRQTVPPHVEAATLKALQKLPADRFASAAQFADALGSATFSAPGIASVPAAARTRVSWLPIAATAILAVLATSAAWMAMAPEPPAKPVVRFRLPFTSGQSLATVTRHALAVSPDGSEMAFATPYQLLRRRVSQLDVEPVQGSESQRIGVSNPAYSPDGKSIAFWSNGAIRRIALSVGAVVTVYETPNPFGIHWDESGIVFAYLDDIIRVSPDGGTPEVIVDLPADEATVGPQMLPGGTDVLFTWAQGLGADRWERAKIVVQNIKTGKRTILIDGGSDGRYLPSGHIVYALGGNLLAVPFDLGAMKVTGGPVPVVEGIRRGIVAASGVAHYAFSSGGTLAFVPGPAGGGSAAVDMALTDRAGGTQRLGLPPAPYEFPRISPDGQRLAVGTDDGKEATIWVYPLNGSSAIRRLTLTGKDRFPIWSTDGVWIAFQSMRDGDAGIFRQRADGSGTVERLTTAETGATHTPESWSPTENGFLFSTTRNDTSTLMMHSLSTGSSVPYGDVRSIGSRLGATFSPDGKWVTYSASERSGTEVYVYVQPFPATGSRYQISQSGENGHHPMWSRDQKELLYVPLVGQLAARSVTTGPTFAFGNPVQIPRTFPVAAPTTPRTFDITPDRRVVGVIASSPSPDGRGGGSGAASAAALEVVVVLNWFEELKARVKSP